MDDSSGPDEPFVIGVAGFKNAGKTTLVVGVVEELTRRGVRVATIKHAHHDFDVDRPGKDSWRHRQAGAGEVIVASATRWAHIRELGDEGEPALSEFLGRLGHVDVVIVEGYKHGPHDKIEVRAAESDEPFLAAADPSVVAVAADGPLAGVRVPVFARSDIPGIAGHILKLAGAR